jgi:hypothetical protein
MLPKPTDPPPKPARQPSAPPPSRTVKLSDLQEIGGREKEVFIPSDLPLAKPKIDPGVLYLIIGTAITLFIFVVYLIVRPSGDNTTASAPPLARSPQPRISQPAAPLPPVPQAPIVAVAPPPSSASTEPTTRQAVAAATRPEWFGLKPVRPKLPPAGVTDAMIGEAIQKGGDYLAAQYANNELIEKNASDYQEGANVLGTYALLHAGQAISDSRLQISSPFMQGLLGQMKKFDLNESRATYAHSLRASALALVNRAADQSALGGDLQWLLKSSVDGAYTYAMPPKGATSISWDNSNSQYGVLGIWAAADAGLSVPPGYWNEVEKHWLESQNTDGGWGYSAGDPTSRLSMTCAGLTTLCVVAEQRSHKMIAGQGSRDPDPPMTRAIQRALGWLDTGNHSVDLGSYSGYTLYGLERAALASGFKWFGQHDWYSELATQVIRDQKPDGSWSGSFSNAIATSFRLLFLSRGRQPLLVNKLRFDGYWNNRPRDASKLAEFVSTQLEQPFAWGIADLSRHSWEWLDSPLLFITTDTPPDLNDEDYAKLRDYTDQGGLIFIHNEWSTPAMDDFVAKLAAKVFPEYPLEPLPADHAIYSDVIHLANKPPLKAVSNGSRLLLIYSPTDLTKAWITRSPKDNKNPQSQLGLNLFIYAAGKDGFHRRLDSSYIPPPAFAPGGTIPIVRVQYPGAWNPEPAALARFSRWFQNQTSLALAVQPSTLAKLSTTTTPIAFLTGNAAADFSTMDLHALHNFVAQGGVLLIDAAGGSKPFIDSVRDQLLPRAFPEGQLVPLMPENPILAGTGDCMDPLPKPRLRRYAAEQLNGKDPALDLLSIGKGAVIISDLDVTTGLLDTGQYGIIGYTPSYAQSLVKNIVLWTLSRAGG